MAIALVQSKVVNSAAVAVMAQSITLDAPPTAGNILVLSASVFSTGGSIVLNQDPNITWMYWSVSTSNSVSMVVAVGRVFAGAGSTFTLNQSANGGLVISVQEYSGTYITVDRFISNAGASTAQTTGTTGTTSKLVQLWIGIMASRNAVVFSSPTNGFTILLQSATSILGTQDRSLAVMTLATVAAGTATTTVTASVNSVYYGAMLTLQENPTGSGGGETAFGSAF